MRYRPCCSITAATTRMCGMASLMVKLRGCQRLCGHGWVDSCTAIRPPDFLTSAGVGKNLASPAFSPLHAVGLEYAARPLFQRIGSNFAGWGRDFAAPFRVLGGTRTYLGFTAHAPAVLSAFPARAEDSRTRAGELVRQFESGAGNVELDGRRGLSSQLLA